ncbi:MAG: fibronectin type III domain-containing protein [bacterium]|nr:fibronectin type III domain-containing protein [bacterium]
MPEGTLRYATNSSGAWVSTNIYQFDPFSIFRFRPSIARDDLGAIHILFNEGFNEFRYITQISGAWYSMGLNAASSYSDISHSMAAGPSGAPIAVWTGVCAGNLCLVISELERTGWNAEAIYDPGMDNIGASVLAMGPDDSMHIIIEKNGNLNYLDNTSGAWTMVENIDWLGGGGGNIFSLGIGADSLAHVSYHSGNGLMYATNVPMTPFPPGDWRTETIDFGSWFGWNNSLSLGDSGDVHIAYTDDSTPSLKYVSNQSGAWINESVYSDSVFSPSLDLDSGGFAHIAFCSNGLLYSTDSSGSWQTETIDPECWGSVSLKIAPDQTVHIAYINSQGLMHADNSGGTWHTEVVIGIMGECHLDVDQDGKIHITFFDGGASELKYATKSGGNWEISSIDPNLMGLGNSLAVDSTKHPHVIYKKNNLLYHSSNLLGYFNPITTIVNNSVNSFNSIDVDSQDNPSIGYMQNGKYKRAYLQNQVWQFEYIDISSFYSYDHNALHIDNDDKIHVIYDPKYADNTAGDWNYYDFSYLGTPDLAIDSQRKAHISYYDYGLYYVTNRTGTWSYRGIDTGGYIGENNAVALDRDDYAYIAYTYRSINNSIKLASNKTGAWTTEAIESNGFSDFYGVDLGVDPMGYVHLAYMGPGYQLKFALKTSTWSIIPLEDISSNNISLALDPRWKDFISYSKDEILKLATNAAGGWTIYVLDSNPSVGSYNSIAIDSKGYAHISYSDDADLDLKYCTNSPDHTTPTQFNWNPPSGGTASPSPTITLQLSEIGDCRWSLLDQSYDEMTGDCSGDGTTDITCAVSGLPDGTPTIYIACRDTFGNADTAASNSHITYNVDSGPPETTITVYPSNPSPQNDAYFEFGSSEPGSSFECWLDADPWFDCDSPQYFSGLAEGTRVFEVRARDQAGNADPTPANYSWIIDFFPETTITSHPSNPTNQTDANFSFTSSETGSTFECKLDAGGWISCVSPNIYNGLSDGGHTFEVRAIDGSGNVDPTPASFSWTIDTIPPDTAITSNPLDPSFQTSAAFTFTATEAGSIFECKLDSGTWSACTSPKNYTGLVEENHSFNVRAQDPAGNKDNTPAAFSWAVILIPLPPSNLQAMIFSASQIDLNWTDNSNNENGFKVEQKIGAGSYNQIGTTLADVTTYSDPTPVCDNVYYYRVKAYDLAGDSIYSNEINALVLICPPSNLQASPVGSFSIDLSWADNSIIESGFKIDRKAQGGSYAQISTLGSNVTSKQDTGLNCETTYYYRIRAYQGSNNSSYSNEISATTGLCPPNPPSYLEATAISTTQINLSWYDNSDDENGFKIERKTEFGSYSTIESLPPNSVFYQNTGLNQGTKYYYRVVAYNAAGDSNYSNEDDATTFTWSGLNVSGGGNHTCATDTSNEPKCWGKNTQGQLGNGNNNDNYLPTDVTDLSGISEIAGGYMHTCSLSNGGEVKCWGDNQVGQLGDNSTNTSNIPVNVSGLSGGVATISSGYIHSCAVTSDGRAKCWGFNQYGQIGNATNNNYFTTPQDVYGVSSGATDISCGRDHTCAVINGGAKCWGHNNDYQLGTNNNIDRSTPYSVIDAYGVVAIAAGGNHSCALTNEGGVKCWGSNGRGELGTGDTYSYPTAMDVSGLFSGVSQITAGFYHTCALTTSGGVKCWGYNSKGELGDGTTTQSLIPIDVWGLSSGVVYISAGTSDTCAVLQSGAVKCWGENNYGQLGIGINNGPQTDGYNFFSTIPVNIGQ